MTEADFVLAIVEEKYREHLEMLATPDEKLSVLSNILASMLYKEQQENIYLRRRLQAECIEKSA